MKNEIKLFPLFCLLFLFFLPFNKTIAQVDIDVEKIREKCKGKPYEERVRVTVARFNVTSRAGKAFRGFGDELATMLTNVLQEINCFRVLESLKNMSDMTDELEMGNSKYIDSESAPDIGKMLGAQAVFTGEITEFQQTKGNGGAFGVTVSSSKTTIGFVIKLINPETREVLWSQSLESKGKTPGTFSGAKVMGFNLIGRRKNSGSLTDNVERGMVKAIYELTKEMDVIRFPEVEEIDNSNTNVTTLNLTNIDYSEIKKLTNLLDGEESIRSVKRTGFQENYGTVKVRHEGSVEDLMDLLESKGVNLYKITGISDDGIGLTWQ